MGVQHTATRCTHRAFRGGSHGTSDIASDRLCVDRITDHGRLEIDDKNSPVVDGALFALTMNDPIDPEVLLVIEAQRTDDGVRWQYAPIRFTNREAWVN